MICEGDHVLAIRGEPRNPTDLRWQFAKEFPRFQMPYPGTPRTAQSTRAEIAIVGRQTNSVQRTLRPADAVEGMDDWRIGLDLHLLFAFRRGRIGQTPQTHRII